MSKLFFEVFPTLKTGDELRALFSDVEVTKVSTNSMRTFIKVCLVSRRHLVCMCVCPMYMFMYIRACVQAWGGQTSKLSVFLNHFSTLFFEPGSLTEPEAHRIG